MNMQKKLAALLMAGTLATDLMAMEFGDTQNVSHNTQSNQKFNRDVLTSKIESDINMTYAQLINAQEESTAYFFNAQFNEGQSQTLQQKIDQLQSQYNQYVSLFDVIYKGDFWTLFDNESYFAEKLNRDENLLPLFYEARQTYLNIQEHNDVKAWKESLTINEQIAQLLSVLDLSRPIGIIVGACPSEGSHFANVDGIQLIYVDSNLGQYLQNANRFDGATTQDLESPYFMHADITQTEFLQQLLSSPLAGAVDFITADAGVCHWFDLQHNQINLLLCLIKNNGKIVLDYNSNASCIRGDTYSSQTWTNDVLESLAKNDNPALKHLMIMPKFFVNAINEQTKNQCLNDYMSYYTEYLHDFNGYRIDGFIKMKQGQLHPFWNPAHATLNAGCPFYLEITKNQKI